MQIPFGRKRELSLKEAMTCWSLLHSQGEGSLYCTKSTPDRSDSGDGTALGWGLKLLTGGVRVWFKLKEIKTVCAVRRGV